MKKIILKKISLTNWRGERQQTIEFKEKGTTICGDNGLGKSRIFDAFMWLLFGKDSQDRKDFEIKTIIDGVPLEKTDAEVIADIVFGDEKITLRRVLHEEWTKPEGQTESVFKGNKTNCYWNDVPINVTEYARRLNLLINDTVFKLITNPLYFANMKWQEQREQLFQMAGTITNGEIAENNADFKALLDRISSKSFDDYKKEINARKRALRSQLEEVNPRIDQIRRLMPKHRDYAELETQIKELEDEIMVLMQTEQINNKGKQKIEGRLGCLSILKIKINSAENNKLKLKESIQFLQKEIEELREHWKRENINKYDAANNICPYCKQELPTKMLEEVQINFENEKRKRLQSFSVQGKSINVKIAELNNQIKKEDNLILTLKKEFDDIQIEIREQSTENNKNSQINDNNSDKLKSLQDELTVLKVQLSERELIAKYEKEIEQWNEYGNNVALQIAHVEREEYIMAQFSKKKITEYEKRINLLFTKVKFKFFNCTIDGNESETCIPLVNGVPFSITNSAGRINAGLDIINSLCKFYKINAPIFIDNAESINKLLQTSGQIIKLAVSLDKELVIK